MPRYAPQMTQADLRQKLIDLAIENDYIEDYGDIDPLKPDLSRILGMLLEELLPTVEKDWSKIDFSTENLTVTAEKMTDDGIPYVEISAGGDWETPLICIIYFDGKTFRGYVPKDGNTYNHQEKSAFGNNNNDDAAYTKQFGTSKGIQDGYIEQDPDIVLVTQDINSRLEAKGTHQHIQTKVISKAAMEAKRQAEIEKDQDLTGDLTADMVHAVISLAAGGSYVTFQLRSSGRKLTADEGNRLVGVPAILDKTSLRSSDEIVWYSPMNIYPMQTLAMLEAAGFQKAPDNDIEHTRGVRTVIITG